MSIYSLAKLGASDNQVVFNDYGSDPIYRVLARAPSKWQIRQQDLPVPFESGSNDFITLIGESAYILSGKMYPSSETSYDTGLAKLRTVCSLDFEQNDNFTDGGYVPYTWGDAGGDYQKIVYMKPLYVQLAETTQQGFIQPFTIYSKVKDPTIYGNAKTATTQSANFGSTTGSAIVPFVVPIVVGASSSTVSATATNNGTIASYPSSIIVHGPVNVPKITNGATGEYISVNCNLGSSSDVLTITYDKDTFSIDLNGTSQIQNLTTNSTLFKIQPGSNVISLTGSSISTNAYAVVNYADSWPLA